MKKVFFSFIILGSCHLVISMDSTAAALHRIRFERDTYRNETMAYLKTQTGLDIPRSLFYDGQKKYNEIANGWSSQIASPIKPFEQCTWNEINDAANGDSSKLVCPYIPTPAKY